MTEAKIAGPTRLHQLLSMKLAGQIECEEFCRKYEHAYNFEVGRGELKAEEAQIFEDLFDVVAWFAADEDARSELPTHFKDQADVEAAVRRAGQQLTELRSPKVTVSGSGSTTPT